MQFLNKYFSQKMILKKENKNTKCKKHNWKNLRATQIIKSCKSCRTLKLKNKKTKNETTKWKYNFWTNIFQKLIENWKYKIPKNKNTKLKSQNEKLQFLKKYFFWKTKFSIKNTKIQKYKNTNQKKNLRTTKFLKSRRISLKAAGLCSF